MTHKMTQLLHMFLNSNFTVRNYRENLGNSFDKVLPLGFVDMGLPKTAEAQTLITPFATCAPCACLFGFLPAVAG